MSPATFRERNGMSRSEWDRRRLRQRLGEVGSAKLLPKIIQIGPQKYGVTYEHEREWQNSLLVSA